MIVSMFSSEASTLYCKFCHIPQMIIKFSLHTVIRMYIIYIGKKFVARIFVGEGTLGLPIMYQFSAVMLLNKWLKSLGIYTTLTLSQSIPGLPVFLFGSKWDDWFLREKNCYIQQHAFELSILFYHYFFFFICSGPWEWGVDPHDYPIDLPVTSYD